MDHGGGDKGDGVFAETPGIALPDLLDLPVGEGEAELVQQDDGLGRGDDLHLRPAEQNFLDGGGVVRLHVVDDQVVQGPAVQHGLDVFNELPSHGPVRRVEQDGLFVQQDVGVVADAVVQGMDVFKQGQAVVVGAYPVQVIGNFTDIMHMITSLSGRFFTLRSR